MSKNLCNKTRPVDNPYEIWAIANFSWIWAVLRKYQNSENEAKNPYARWFCAVSSPFTRGQMASGFELGDVYVSEIVSSAYKIWEGGSFSVEVLPFDIPIPVAKKILSWFGME